MTSGRCFAEAAGLIGSEASVPNLFGGKPGADTAVGQILGNNLGRFRSRFDEQTVSNDPLAQGDPFFRNQNRVDSGVGHLEGGNTASDRDVGHFGG
jgi:hypothetical protein